MPLELTSARRSELRAQAHSLRPVVLIGDAGLGPAVLNEIDRNLASHELIKIRISAAPQAARATMLAEICDALAAAPVQHIGKTLVVFRPRPEEPTAKTQKTRTRRKPPRRTKRSFQR
jgi:putative YhbY family RNA-binding protein